MRADSVKDAEAEKGMDQLLFKDECYQLVGAAIEMRKELGLGFLEPVYQEAFAIVLKDKGIPFVKEAPLPIHFRGKTLEKRYYADFLCFNKIVLEFKAVKTILPEHEAQVINYLRCTGYRLGLIFNFNSKGFFHYRIAL